MSHTPGPWTVEDLSAGSRFAKEWRGIGPYVVQPSGYERNGEPVSGVQISEDDARLIAAAPEMLEALDLADDILGRHYSADDEDTRGGVALKAIRNARRRARGESA